MKSVFLILAVLTAFSASAADTKHFKNMLGGDTVCTTSAVAVVQAEASVRSAADNAITSAWLSWLGTNGYVKAEADPVAGPRLALLEGKADNWDASFGWGNHALAGYLGAAAWFDWLGTNTYVKTESDPAALAALDKYAETNRVTRLHDSAQPSRYFIESVNGTGTVFEVTGPFTNLIVTLSENFEETARHTRPAWTNNVFPFIDDEWSGYVYANYQFFVVNLAQNVYWESDGLNVPSLLPPFSPTAQGTATVSVANIYYTTNAIKHLATEAELETAKAQCGVVLTNTVAAATNALMPYTQTLYGDFATTNETGYAAFLTTNSAVSSTVVVPSGTSATNSAKMSYPIAGQRLASAKITAYSQKLSGTTFFRSTLSLCDSGGSVLSSNVFYPPVSGTPDATERWTNSLDFAGSMVTSGFLRVEYTIASTSGAAKVMISGGNYPTTLILDRVPTPYTTAAELGTLSASIPGIVYSNAVSQMVVWTNATGAVTNMAVCEGGTWKTNAFGAGEPLPEGIVTNGQYDVTLGEITISGATIRRRNEADYWKYIGAPSLDLLGGQGGLRAGSIHVNNTISDQSWGSTEIGWVYNRGVSIRTNPDVLISGVQIERVLVGLDGNVSVSNNLAAAAFSTTGTVSASTAILRDSGQPVSWEFSVSNGLFYASTNGVRAYKLTVEAP